MPQRLVPTPMPNSQPVTLTQQELAQRWGRSVTAIGLCSAMGMGPKYINESGSVKYPFEEVQKYERARLMH